MTVVKGGQNLSFLVEIGLTDLPNIGGLMLAVLCESDSIFHQFYPKYNILYKNCSESVVQIPARAGQNSLPLFFPFLMSY